MYPHLSDLRVVEISSFVAAPLAGLQLAHLGADVIRIDQLGGGPDRGRWPVTQAGSSLFWEGLNRGKRSVAIDMRQPEGRELAQAIATAPGAGAGLLVTNLPVSGFLSHAHLSALRADQITVRVMGWPDGRNAVDYTVNPSIGLPMMTGPEDDERPVNHVLPAWDLLTGTTAALALVAAERHRAAGGGGAEIRLPLSDMAMSTLSNLGMVGEAITSGRDRTRSGNHLFGAFGRDFITACGQRIMIVALTPRQWRGLVHTLRIADAIAAIEAEGNVDFTADEGQRFVLRDRLDPLVAKAVAARQLDELGAAFDAEGVCWEKYRSLHEAVSTDPRLVTANPLFGAGDHPSGETYPVAGFAATICGMERGAPLVAPRIGHDTDVILGEVLGLGDAQIGRLLKRGVIGTAPTADPTAKT